MSVCPASSERGGSGRGRGRRRRRGRGLALVPGAALAARVAAPPLAALPRLPAAALALQPLPRAAAAGTLSEPSKFSD